MLATSLSVAQWLEHPTGVRKVMGSIPVGDYSRRGIFHLFLGLILLPVYTCRVSVA